MSSPRWLAAALVGVRLLITATACQSSTPHPQGSTVKTESAQIPSLPNDRDAARAAYCLRRRERPDRRPIAALRAMRRRPGGAMTSAVWADGWKQAGVSHGVNVRKGPSFFSGARDTTGATW